MDARIAIAALFLVGGAVVALAGASPQATLTPEQALEADPGAVSVKGAVADVDRANATFELTDGTHTLTVHHTAPLPEAVEEGRSLVARGTLTGDTETRALQADEIQLGCPSKYEA